MTYNGRRLVLYGVPRVMAASELMRVGEYRGVPIFVVRTDEPDEWGRIRVFYLPLRPGCEFQPFLDTANVGAVRGRQ